ncbi:MAG: hypothetical protein JO132_05970 [Streptosporangiaceae bacterium]|nr:hypothetical protein [Streptosporangiaceae bacterium]
MTDTPGPDEAAPAEQIGLGAPEAAAPASAHPRNARSWAHKVDRLQPDLREGVRGTNVAGRRLAGPVQGFGKMWQKTYRMNAGPGIAPAEAISIWRKHFSEFWPAGNRFSTPITNITPGDVALLDLRIGGGVKLSTGVFVLYADAESFTLMTPQGHLFAGWITFSAARDGEDTIVQAQALFRAGDPLYELAMPIMHRREDQFWLATLTALGERLGAADPEVEISRTCVDSRRQWRYARNIWHNSAIRSLLQAAADRRKRGNKSGTGQGGTGKDDKS